MPSTEKPQGKFHFEPGAPDGISKETDEKSFVDTYTDLPENKQSEDISHPTPLNSLDTISNELGREEVADDVLSEISEAVVELDIDTGNDDFENAEPEVTATALADVTTQIDNSEATEVLEMAVTPPNSKNASPHVNAPAPVAAPTTHIDVPGKAQDLTHPNQTFAKDEVPFETLPRYIKSVGDSSLANHESLTRIQSRLHVSADMNFPLTPANLSLPGGTTILPSSPIIQAQANLNILTIPMRDVAQNVVQATLKQERTLIRIDPPELGRIQLDFDHSSSGKTIVTLSAEIDSVKLMLIERRAFMIGLFEGYGLEDVEIQVDNELESNTQSSDGQLFSNQEASPKFNDTSETSEISVAQADLEENGIPQNTRSTYQPENNRLHIRV